jgi:cytosine/creatinine deaminase
VGSLEGTCCDFFAPPRVPGARAIRPCGYRDPEGRKIGLSDTLTPIRFSITTEIHLMVIVNAIDADRFMDAALEEAAQGLREGGIPIGAVLVHRGQIIGRGHNRRVQQGSAIRHGEMDALENAGRQPASVYRESAIYTTLSPCSMCSGAILLYGIPRVIVGENTTFLGEEALLRSRGVTVDVVQDPRCVQLMEAFIRAHPELWNEDIGSSG